MERIILLTIKASKIPHFEKGGLGGIMKPYNPILKPFSRNLRSNMTDAEQLLWSKLRRKQILGLQFYRQKPVSGFIVDFYCAAANLVIELDGSQHFEPEHQIKDAQRDKKLKSLGLQVLRFDNHQVLTELDKVMSVVFDIVEKKIPPNPPFAKGGIKAVTTETDTHPVEKVEDINTPIITEETPNSSLFEEETRDTPPFEKGGQGGFPNKDSSA
jgi:very-short-patch-repair endonuclease